MTCQTLCWELRLQRLKGCWRRTDHQKDWPDSSDSWYHPKYKLLLLVTYFICRHDILGASEKYHVYRRNNDSRRSNPSILKEINPNFSLEGLMLKPKLQYFDHLMQKPTHWKRPWCWDGGGREWDVWMAWLTQWTWVCTNSGRQWRTGKPGVLQSMGSQTVGHDWATQRQTW